MLCVCMCVENTKKVLNLGLLITPLMFVASQSPFKRDCGLFVNKAVGSVGGGGVH